MQGVANMLIRPKRAVYSSLELGPRRFSIRNRRYVRKDIHILNERNQRLRCSHYMPEETYTIRIPCIIICHGNCGNRLDAIDIVEMLLPHDISVLSLDFSGSGLSEGDYVSLGYFEQKDIASVVEYLWRTEKISAIGLWGRSMGAVAALLYAARDPGICLVIADSPFSSLRELCIDILKQYLVTVTQRLPRAISNFLITKLKKIVQEKAGFDIDDVDPLKEIQNVRTPLIFLHSVEDTLINISHSQILAKSYIGQAKLIELTGGHNDPRDSFAQGTVMDFILTRMKDDSDEEETEFSVEHLPKINKSVIRTKLPQHSRNETRLCPTAGIPYESFELALQELRKN